MANSIDLEFLKVMFKEALTFATMYKVKSVEDFGKITPMIFSHLYSFINAYYMYFVIQKIAMSSSTENGITLFLKSP